MGKSPSVLVADDEQVIRRPIRALLAARGFTVHEATTGKEALRSVETLHPDVIVLDLGLPDLDGIVVTGRLRKVSDAAIIILSVRDTQSDKIAALDAGADDYLTKPCRLGDLLERIRAAVTREEQRDAGIFTAGNLMVDLERGFVTIDSAPVQLTADEFALLKVLARNRGRLLTHHRLASKVWGERAVEENLHTLRTAIHSLRAKLEENPTRPRRIVTEPGVGYRLRTES
ncbi:MAG: response regulator transcription factor [Bryobacterales bacterium]|nr:response regulator transcription factor [Bryobacterales bacterium]